MDTFRSWFRSEPSSDELIVWSKQGVRDLREQVKVKASRTSGDQEPPRILFLGETGSGKSSFICSVMSALGGDVTYPTMIGDVPGREENTSKRYLEYQVFMGEEKEPMNFILCDARGIGKKNQLGVAVGEIQRLMDGKLRHNDLIESERDSDGTLIDSRTPKPPCGVVFVQKAQRLGKVDQDVQNKLDEAANIARERGLPCSVILTHIDVAKPSLTKKLHKALDSYTLRSYVQRAAEEIGVSSSRVFLVKNYTTEKRTHVHQDTLILRALHGILVDVSSRHRSVMRGAVAKTPSPLPIRDMLGRPNPRERNEDKSQHRLSRIRSRLFQSISSQYTHDSGFSDIEQTKPKTNQHREETIPKSRWERGEEYVGCYISDDRTERKMYDGSGSAECDDESISDEGHQDSSSEEESDHSCTNRLKKVISNLANKPFPDAYCEDASLHGAKPLFQPTVKQLKDSSQTCDDADEKLSHQLHKAYHSEDAFCREVYSILQQFCGLEAGSVWMSDTLPVDLDLPQDTLPPISTDLQVFVLASGRPPFLLTLFDLSKLKDEDQNDTGQTFHGDRTVVYENVKKGSDIEVVLQEEVEKVKLYTLQLGKLLTTALLSFCSCDFLLLPLCLSVEGFAVAALEEGLQQQQKVAQQFFGGPLKLSVGAYHELKAAAVAVTGVSILPGLMSSCAVQGLQKEEETQFVLMAEDWRAAVSLLVETLITNPLTELTYPPEAEVKCLVAVVEAAKRLSFADPVLLCTPNTQLLGLCGTLMRQVFEDTGVTLKLTVRSPGERLETDDVIRPSYVILVDCHPQFEWTETECIILRVARAMVPKQRAPQSSRDF